MFQATEYENTTNSADDECMSPHHSQLPFVTAISTNTAFMQLELSLHNTTHAVPEIIHDDKYSKTAAELIVESLE